MCSGGGHLGHGEFCKCGGADVRNQEVHCVGHVVTGLFCGEGGEMSFVGMVEVGLEVVMCLVGCGTMMPEFNFVFENFGAHM